MLKKEVTILLVVFLFLIQIVNAEFVGIGKDGKPQFTDQNERDKLAKDFPGIGLSDESTVSVVNGEFVIDEGPITLNGEEINGEGITIDKDGRIARIRLAQIGDNIILDATDYEQDGEDFSASTIGSARLGPIVLTNGINVRWQGKVLSADHVDSLIEIENVITQADMIVYDDREITVERAELIWAGCIRMEDVTDSKIIARTEVTIEADGGVEFDLEDCAQNDIHLKSLSDDSSVVINKQTVDPKYAVTDAEITVTKNGITEFVNTGVIATAAIHRRNGIQSLIMGNGTTYGYRTDDPLQAFNLKSGEQQHNLYIKKSANYEFPVIVEDCSSCSIVDFANHNVEVKGIVEIGKNQIRKKDGLNLGMMPFFTTTNQNSRAVLTFGPNNIFVELLSIRVDAPDYITVISNYLTISEESVNGQTVRLVDIDESVEEDELTYSLVKNYRTAYQNGVSTTIDNNMLKYVRGGAVVEVLPPGHSLIDKILEKVRNKSAIVLLGLLPFFFFRKKGQITVFLLMGVMILLVVGVAVYLLPQIGTDVSVTSQQDVSDFVDSCLEIAGSESLTTFGLQGGHIPFENPFIYDSVKTSHLYDRGAANLPVNGEQAVSSKMTQGFITCIDNFAAISGATFEIKSSPQITTTFGASETVFELDYKFTVRRGGNSWNFDTFTTTVRAPMATYLRTANSIVNSQVQLDGKINLDDLPSTKISFFPLDNTLVTWVEDPNSFASNGLQSYAFLFANRR